MLVGEVLLVEPLNGRLYTFRKFIQEIEKSLMVRESMSSRTLSSLSTHQSSDLTHPSFTIAVIGDVHDQWEPDDEAALHHLNVDLALFVGDFGNESVDVVRAIAQINLPKAVVLGNHDAWYNATEWGRSRCPYDAKTENRVQQQLDLLGDAHVGYGKLDLPELGLTVVGGRPFSWGGPEWKNKTFYRTWYGVHSFEQSVEKMNQVVDSTAFDTLLFVGHCGPTGLGDRPESTCGRDWRPIGGDYGDPDLTQAIAHAQSSGKQIPLVTFGHMHHNLRHRKDRVRDRLVVGNPDAATPTVYLNAASVPRIKEEAGKSLRNMTLVTLESGRVTRAALVWTDAQGAIATEDLLYESPRSFASVSS